MGTDKNDHLQHMETGYKMTFTTMETGTKSKFSGKVTFTNMDTDTKS